MMTVLYIVAIITYALCGVVLTVSMLDLRRAIEESRKIRARINNPVAESSSEQVSAASSLTSDFLMDGPENAYGR